MFTLGIDIGASSVKLAALEVGDGLTLSFSECRSHQGSPLICLKGLLSDLDEVLSLGECESWVVTGSGAGLLADLAHAHVLEAVPALCQGASFLAPCARSIVEIGAQNSLYVVSSASEEESAWSHVPVFAVNEGCASGTGSFFEDQMGRLGLCVEDYSKLVARAQTAPRLSGRCSVFAKTDIIHRQQEGVAVEDILLGLCFAMVKSLKAAIVRGLEVKLPLALSGGVLENEGVVRAVREVFKLSETDLIAEKQNKYFQAVGAAAEATKVASSVSLVNLLEILSQESPHNDLPRLHSLPSFEALPQEEVQALRLTENDQKLTCVLGVDVGSTSTNLVLLDCSGKLRDAQYLRTRGNPKKAVMEGLQSLKNRFKDCIEIKAVGVTGSGRSMIGEVIGADVVRDEITAQARAAFAADCQVDTVFEIGGQDSKYICLKEGQVADFQMNKICAAGTGSFIEEQAIRLDIELKDYGTVALSAKNPINLGERCTVFVEAAVNEALAKGASKSDIAAGLCHSVVRNYLQRVVGTKPVGSHVVLQGGVAYNPGIVAAFKSYFGDNVSVSPWFAVSGAVGVAYLALEENIESTLFRGFDLEKTGVISHSFNKADIEENRRFFRKLDTLFLDGYDPSRDPRKKTVGVPRCLMLHKLFPMVNAFFKELGYNVLLSDVSSEETVRLSQQTSQGETCYPVKLIHGHVEQLLQSGVDYIFMPAAHTIRHPQSKVNHNYACSYMQTAPRLVAKELDFAARGVELISPQLEMDFGQQAIAEALLGVGAQLGKSPQESARAMLAGGFAVREFTRKTEELGEQLLNSLKPNERVIVLLTRNYGIVDPMLNAGVPDALLDRGQKVITVSHLHAHDLDISTDYPGLYWPFGQHIVSGAKLVRRDPRLFGVYLTNHGCGPDTMVSHMFRQEMTPKPYLHIEVDEHFSPVGVITRVEAFLNAIDKYETNDEASLPLCSRTRENPPMSQFAHKAIPASMPSIGVFGSLVGTWLESRGYQVSLVTPDASVVELGRQATVSKEYLTFNAMAGVSLFAARNTKRCESGSLRKNGVSEPEGEQVCLDDALQILLPSSEGAEADGQYDRVIRVLLDEKGFDKVKIVAPKLDQLPWTCFGVDELFAALLAGDVVYSAHFSMREDLLTSFTTKGISFDEVCKAARLVGQAAGYFSSKKTLGLVGEWPCVYSDELTENCWIKLERENYRLMRMPLSEYLLFLWRDARDADLREKAEGAFILDPSSKGVMPLPEGSSLLGDCSHSSNCVCNNKSQDITASKLWSLEEKDSQLEHFERQIKQVHSLLGLASSFSGNFEELRETASSVLGSYRGSNGRYRMAKVQCMASKVDGAVTAASMYENTDIVMKLLEDSATLNAPVLHLSFDGVLGQGAEDRLGSFLYYL